MSPSVVKELQTVDQYPQQVFSALVQSTTAEVVDRSGPLLRGRFPRKSRKIERIGDRARIRGRAECLLNRCAGRGTDASDYVRIVHQSQRLRDRAIIRPQYVVAIATSEVRHELSGGSAAAIEWIGELDCLRHSADSLYVELNGGSGGDGDRIHQNFRLQPPWFPAGEVRRIRPGAGVERGELIGVRQYDRPQRAAQAEAAGDE